MQIETISASVCVGYGNLEKLQRRLRSLPHRCTARYALTIPYIVIVVVVLFVVVAPLHLQSLCARTHMHRLCTGCAENGAARAHLSTSIA